MVEELGVELRGAKAVNAKAGSLIIENAGPQSGATRFTSRLGNIVATKVWKSCTLRYSRGGGDPGATNFAFAMDLLLRQNYASLLCNSYGLLPPAGSWPPWGWPRGDLGNNKGAQE